MNSLPRFIAVSGLAALSPLSMQAQAVNTADPAVVMSPFVVDVKQDSGYRASNTISGTSLNTAIKELPMAIQVVTNEFMQDIAATDFVEAAAYSSGVFSDTQEAAGGANTANANEGGGSAERSVSASARRNRFANVVTIRGFDTPFQTRLGFRVGGLVITPTTSIALGGLLDAVNMDRLEVVKGPNSLLYGVGVLSGIVNAIPKKPVPRVSLNTSFSAGSEGFQRTTADISSPLVRKTESGHSLNLRLAGSWENRDHWTDWQTKNQRYNVAQLDYYFRDKVNAFFEFQTAETKFNGTGDQWVFDDTGGSEPLFRNEYDEAWNFARHAGVIKGLDLVKRQIVTHDNRGQPLRTPRVDLFYSQPNPALREMEGGGLPNTYRITGPDTYEKRNEKNYLFNVDVTPTKNLAFSGGLYYTEQKTEELALNVVNQTNGGGGTDIRQTLQSIAESDYIGPGGPWPDQKDTQIPIWAVANPIFIARDNLSPLALNPLDNAKVTRYWWSKRPTSSESFQWRMRATYTKDAELPWAGASKHTFLLGNHFINDQVRFLNGEETLVRAYNRSASATDALYFRPVNDYSVFRYNGETLAMPGTRYSQQTIWFKGYYGVYQGRFWNDRLGLLAGVRFDQYNAATKDFIRLDPARTAGLTKQQIQAQELGYVYNPDNLTYGSFEPSDNFPKPIEQWSKTAAINYRITPALTAYALYSEGIAPNTGLADGNNRFIEAEETTSKEIGLKFATSNNRLTGSIAAYLIQRKNAIWDFALAPAPARWQGSPNPPVGQALTSNRFDPHPAQGKYVLTYGINAKETPAFFSTAYVAGNSSVVDPATLHRSYFITTRDPAGNPIRNFIPGLIDFANPGGTADSPQIFYVKYSDMDTPFNFQYTNANNQLVSNTYTWRQWFEKAFFNTSVSADVPGQYDPINYTRQESFFGEWKGGDNPSLQSSDGANVTFTDEARGVDLEVIWQPNDNLQVLFNYAYTQREAKDAFNMVDFIDLNDGQIYPGTEYDQIVRVFGREAFGITSEDTDNDGFADRFLDKHGKEISETNPLRPSEAVSGIDGTSLFFNPSHQASAWARYLFTEGRLARLSFGLGANYSSSAPTSVSIGGDEIQRNLFPTPRTAPAWSADAGIFYNLRIGRTRWNLRFNVRNLFDDRGETTYAQYQDDFNNRTVTKRSESFKAPRSYRFTTSVAF